MAQRERLRSTTAADPMAIALGLLAGAVVYVSYYPSDSIAVEQGDALWFAALAIVIATVTWATAAAQGGPGRESFTATSGRTDHGPPAERGSNGCSADGTRSVRATLPSRWSRTGRWADRLLDALPWALGGWMMFAALASSPPGNLRVATNEAWVWISAAAIFTAGRRLFSSPTSRRSVLALSVACAAGLAVHGLHQQWVSLPENRAAYREDPDAVLRMAGMDAPAGSAERMRFESRLFDGGPTGTFALANSLAGVLAVGAVLGAGLLRFRWRRWRIGGRTAGIVAVLLCSAGLLATRSRSGILAALIGIGLVIALGWIRRGGFAWRHRWAAGSLVVALLVVGGTLAAAVGGREFLEQAPASLAFRFQYWRSTLALALDRPWFAAGPGNFQALYEQYREPSASEQIAEPHNFLFETLASGGWVAAALLVGLFAAGLILVLTAGRRGARRPDAAAPAGAAEPDRSRWVALGAGAALILVWLIGFAVGQAPDFEAHLWAVPIAAATAYGLLGAEQHGGQGAAHEEARQVDAGAPEADPDRIAGAALITLLVHLLVSGGWTVPGVAIHVWVLAAMLAPASAPAASAPASASAPTSAVRRWDRRWPAAAAIVAGLGLLVVLRMISVGPVQASASAMSEARAAQSRGQLDRAEAALRRASQADPWGTEPVLWLADLLHWRLVIEGDSPALRQQWHEALEELAGRAGEHPAIYRSVARQQLHLFQRHGRRRDVQAALATLKPVARWAPADQQAAAQLAVVADAAGDPALAQRAAQRAARLSGLGNNLERALRRQYILVARHLGAAAESGPRLQPAERLLANRLSPTGVQAPD